MLTWKSFGAGLIRGPVIRHMIVANRGQTTKRQECLHYIMAAVTFLSKKIMQAISQAMIKVGDNQRNFVIK